MQIKQIHNKNFPFIYRLFLGIFLFTDPFIFFRVIFGNDILVITAIFLIAFYIIIYNYFFFSVIGSYYIRLLAVVLLFSIWSVGVRFYAGVDIMDIIIYLRFIISLFILLHQFFIPKGANNLVYALVLAGVIHLIGVLPYFDFIQERLNQYTAFESGEYSIGIITKRATGFFPAPGYLILLSAALVMIGVDKARDKASAWSICVLGLILGLFTLNRTFILIFLALILAILLFYKKSTVKALLWILPFIVLVVFGFVNEIDFFVNSYENYVQSRFDSQSGSRNNRLYGPTGILTSLEAIKNYPLFGNPVSVHGGSLQAFNGTELIRPHNSILLFFCFYGGIIAIPFVYILSLNFISAIKRLSLKNYPIKFFDLSFLLIFLICMIEPLFETSIFAFFFMSCIFLRKIN